jgi:hypothetical protein
VNTSTKRQQREFAGCEHDDDTILGLLCLGLLSCGGSGGRSGTVLSVTVMQDCVDRQALADQLLKHYYQCCCCPRAVELGASAAKYLSRFTRLDSRSRPDQDALMRALTCIKCHVNIAVIPAHAG